MFYNYYIFHWQVCAVVGGMAMEKQERLLSRHPSIVVATPGRLWSLMNEVSMHKYMHALLVHCTIIATVYLLKIRRKYINYVRALPNI